MDPGGSPPSLQGRHDRHSLGNRPLTEAKCRTGGAPPAGDTALQLAVRAVWIPGPIKYGRGDRVRSAARLRPDVFNGRYHEGGEEGRQRVSIEPIQVTVRRIDSAKEFHSRKYFSSPRDLDRFQSARFHTPRFRRHGCDFRSGSGNPGCALQSDRNIERRWTRCSNWQ